MPQNCTWSWKKILKLRDIDGILYEQYGYRVVYDARSKIEAKLSSVIKGKEWEWQAAKSEDLVSIQSKLPMVKIGKR